MADCGATGSTIDRAARAFFGSSDAKTAASLMNLAVGGSTRVPIPLVAPDTILLPTQSSSLSYQQQHQSARMTEQTMQSSGVVAQQVHSQQPPSMVMPNYHTQQQQQHSQFVPQSMHMQMAMQQQMMRQQQFQQQQMQMHVMLQQQQRQLQMQQHVLAQSAHQAVEEEEDQAQQGHEGIVKGATIEELAAAWAEAEADYEELEAAVNMAAAAHDDEVLEPEAYQFIHSISEQGETSASTSKDWMSEGMSHFEAGDLNEAVKAFEMELQQNNADNATAWKMLGRCHAENDQDREAILCLEQAADRDPYCQEARLALGVSYVNELNHTKALEHLKAWITHDPKYAELDIGDDLYGSGENSGGESDFDEVQRLLLTALGFDPTDGAEVLEALGVVYNVSRDYDAAIDAFQKALQRKGDDYQLYNRLGATMANYNKSDRALPAYKRAIEIKPKYTRAWLNMAISHANLHNYDEAARCYLQTLSLNPSATHCWSYLRVALSCGEHWDLIQHAASMNLDTFHEYFDFI